MRIVIDFDDVLAETMRDGFLPVLNTYQRRMGSPFFEWKFEAFEDWGIAEATGFSEETIAKLFEEIGYIGVAQVDNAVVAVKDLWEQGHELVCLTANKNVPAIRAWLNNHELNDLEVVFEKQKVEWMLKHDYSVIIDDNPQTLVEAANRGKIAFRFERPWNAWLDDWGERPNEKSSGGWYGVWRFFRSYTQTAHIATWEQIVKTPVDPNFPETPIDVAFFHPFTNVPVTEPDPRLPSPGDFVPRSPDQKVWDSYEEMMEVHYSERNEVNNDLLPGQKYTGPMGTTTKPDEFVVTNENGAKQTDLQARFDLLPALAIARVAQVLYHGAEKYGEENWRGLSVAECHNHTIGHAIGYNNSEDLEDLAHAACRALMTLEIALTEWVKDG